MKKRWKFRQFKAEAAQTLNEELKINPVFSELLVPRGIKTFEAAKRFFRPAWEHLHDPFLMKNMDKVVDRCLKAIENKETILLYGDYDVDGTSAVSLLASFLGDHPMQYYVPDRYEEGYGISEQGVGFAEATQCTLMIAVDCGIRDFETAALAAQKGVDLIICDHHLPADRLPKAYAILNPKQEDCKYPFADLSACAIAFKLAQALATKMGEEAEQRLKPLLDLVVISLACDMAPLVDENRTLAHLGLLQLNEAPRLSLAVLCELAKRRKPFNVRDVVFGIGPALNAAGRMDHAIEAIKMLLADSRPLAEQQAQYLMNRNQERRDLQEEMLREAIAILADDPSFHDQKSIVVYRPHWHKGVIGVLAAKLTESYHRPVIVFTKSKDKLVGSARSIGEFDIHQAIAGCGQLTFNFGGHKYAAGLTIEEENFEAFATAFEEIVYQNLTKDDELPTLQIDAQLDFKHINDKFWNILRQFAPFGPGNPSPVFLSKMVKDTGYSKLVKEEHIKLHVRQGDSEPVEGIAYGFAGHFEALHSRNPFHLCYSLQKELYMGRARLQLLVQDMKF